MYDNPPSIDQRTVCALTDASVKGGTWVLLGIDWTCLLIDMGVETYDTAFVTGSWHNSEQGNSGNILVGFPALSCDLFTPYLSASPHQPSEACHRSLCTSSERADCLH